MSLSLLFQMEKIESLHCLEDEIISLTTTDTITPMEHLKAVYDGA